MRRRPLAVALAAFVAALALPPPPAAAQTARPNILVVVTDDMRWDMVGATQRALGARGRFAWMERATPNLDRLAREGFRFANAFTPHALCSPARAAMLTGRYPHAAGVTNNGGHLRAGLPTYASVLRARGWRTGYFGKWHMAKQADRPGFDQYASYLGQGAYFDAEFRFQGGARRRVPGWVDDATTGFAASFVRANRSRPWVAVVGMKSPHGPFEPPPRLASRFAGARAPVPANLRDFAPYDPVKIAHEAGPETVRDYTRTIVGADENVGKLLRALDETGQARRTVVAFVSDNGYFWGEHGIPGNGPPDDRDGNKRQLYDEAWRVPFLLRYPALGRSGVAPAGLVTTVDLMPTLLSLAGAPIPAGVQGRNLAPVLRGAAASVQGRVFGEYFLEPPFTPPTHVALRTPRWKLIQYPGRPQWEELFDLSRDPLERTNLARLPAHAATLRSLRGQLAAEKARLAYPGR